jgi:tRNA U54 and U55 pseudouridine synthase Pus10
MKIYTIPEFEHYYHNTYKRNKMAEAFWNTLTTERFNLTKKKVVKKRKTELTTNHLDLPVNNVIQHKETKDAFNTNKFTDLIIAYLKSVHGCESVQRISSEGRARIIKGKMIRIKGLNVGMEDLQVIIKGRLFAIEVKSPSDRQSDKQKKRMNQVRSDDGVYILATSFDQVQNEILGYLK